MTMSMIIADPIQDRHADDLIREVEVVRDRGEDVPTREGEDFFGIKNYDFY
jgi:hypothetical protein